MSRIPGKETTEDYFALDVRQLKREGLIDAEEMPEELAGVAEIEWISSGFGAGEGYALRPWFRCPQEGCGKRVAILYGRPDTDEEPGWACRGCLDLCYPVELEDRVARLQRKSAKARARLGPRPDLAKPKRMRHETFVRLGREYLEIQIELSEALHERTMGMLETMEKERIAFDI